MNLLVTGVSGFVGRRLVRQLLRAGDRVCGLVLDLGEADALGVDPAVRLLQADLLDPRAVGRAVEAAAPELVVHLGGLSAVGASWTRIPDYYRVNVLGTRHLVSAVAGAVPVVLASSAEVYGRVAAEDLPLVEDRELRPPSPYALTKACAEILVLEAGGLVVRSFNLLGPGQAEGFVLPDFANQLARIERREAPPVLHVGSLEARRDFLHVDDGVAGYEAVVRRGEPGDVYNLASGSSLSIRELLDRLIALTGLEVEVRQDPGRTRPVDVPVLEGDNRRLRGLGWSPRFSVERALRDLWDEVRGGRCGTG
ncbi:MAG TPA: GDP-mannose 4,6-dehydratase [Thermoanaerobaculia bacterium]|nr:GDP-mannose 4,6-dehydratase [Thermoanaerobaculia bacterium]